VVPDAALEPAGAAGTSATLADQLARRTTFGARVIGVADIRRVQVADIRRVQ
jgi:hypothetical protein